MRRILKDISWQQRNRTLDSKSYIKPKNREQKKQITNNEAERMQRKRSKDDQKQGTKKREKWEGRTKTQPENRQQQHNQRTDNKNKTREQTTKK